MKRALVTGGSSPLGSAVALTLAASGNHVIVHANRNVTAAQHTVDSITRAGGSAELLSLDLLASGAATSLEGLAEDEPIQIFVHCVGGQRDTPFAAMSFETWSDIIDLNLNTFFSALRPIIVPMIHSRWGRIIAVSSLTAIAGNIGQTNYAAAKGGMLALVKSLGREYGPRGVTANVVAPGLIDTPKTEILDNFEDLLRMCPARRAGKPEEVAALIGFLASEGAAYISGQMIAVDGGTT